MYARLERIKFSQKMHFLTNAAAVLALERCGPAGPVPPDC